MSMVQVLGSSRINNTTYLAAGAIIWTFVLEIFGTTPLDFSLETIAVVIPGSTGLGLILWSWKPDIRFVERIILWLMDWRDKTFDILFDMSCIIMYIRPWEASSGASNTLYQDLRKEHIRSLRGPELREHIQELNQSFWILLLSFPSFFLISDLLVFSGFWWWTLAILFNIIVIYPVSKANTNLLERVTNLSYSRWVLELFKSDQQNRKTLSFRIPHDVEKEGEIESLKEIAFESVSFAEKKDWLGFDNNIINVLSIVGSTITNQIRIDELSEYYSYLNWVYQNHREHKAIVNVSINNSDLQIPDAVNYHLEKSPHILVESVCKALTKYTELITDRNALCDLDYRLYEPIDEHLIWNLNENMEFNLSGLPYWCNGTDIPSEGTNIANIDVQIRLAIRIVLAVEIGILETLPTLQILSCWPIAPESYLEFINSKISAVMLEHDTGFDSQFILDNIGSLIAKLNVGSEQTYRIAQSLLQRYEYSNFRELVSKLQKCISLYPIADVLLEGIRLHLEKWRECYPEKELPRIIELLGVWASSRGEYPLAAGYFLEATELDHSSVRNLLDIVDSLGVEERCKTLREALDLCTDNDDLRSEIVSRIKSQCNSDEITPTMKK